jgi:hypothetical protein
MAAHGLVKGTITKTIAGTTGFTDTIIIIRGTVIPITDLTTNHTITVMVTTLTLGFTPLPPRNQGPSQIRLLMLPKR